MEFILTYSGIPIGLAECRDARGLSVVQAKPLAALEAIRDRVPQWPEARVTAVGACGLSESIEWRDTRGAAVSATNVDVWLNTDGQLLVFSSFDSIGAGVPAADPPGSTSDGGAADG